MFHLRFGLSDHLKALLDFVFGSRRRVKKVRIFRAWFSHNTQSHFLQSCQIKSIATSREISPFIAQASSAPCHCGPMEALENSKIAGAIPDGLTTVRFDSIVVLAEGRRS